MSRAGAFFAGVAVLLLGSCAAQPDSIRTLVLALASLDPERSFRGGASLDEAADLVERAFRRAGLSPRRETYQVEGRAVHNVSVLLGAEDDPRLVVGAHYDAVFGSPGADDNASGVGVLVELARQLEKEPLGSAVELVAYTLEEPPFFRTPQMGSAVHATRLAEERVRVIGMISLDCVGYFDESPGSQAVPPGFEGEAGNRGDFIAIVGRPADAPLARALISGIGESPAVPLRTFLLPRSTEGLDFSDHLNFWAQGVPAVMVTDTAFLRNPHYHSPSDRPEHLDYRRLRVLADLLSRGVRHVAAQPWSPGGSR